MIHFRVFGTPRPQGSKRAIPTKGRPILIESGDDNLKTWRNQVAVAVREARPEQPLTGPVWLAALFYLPAPQRRPAWPYPAKRPDIDKLLRALLDEITGVIVVDDCQVVSVFARKEWASDDFPPGVNVYIYPGGKP